MASQQQSFQALASEQLRSLNEVCQQLSEPMGYLHMAMSVPVAAPPLVSTPPPAPPPVRAPTPAPMLHLSNPRLPPLHHLASSNSGFPDLSGVLSFYLDLKEVFNKAGATSLPLYRPFDCCIDLLPGSSPPRGRHYSRSAPEREAMQTYIHSTLKAEVVWKSPFLLGQDFSSWTKRIRLSIHA